MGALSLLLLPGGRKIERSQAGNEKNLYMERGSLLWKRKTKM